MGAISEIRWLVQIPAIFNQTERPRELWQFCAYLGQGQMFHMLLDPLGKSFSYLGDN